MTIRQANKNIYWAWKAMKQRCLNPNCKAFNNYGARGISICKEWYEFEPFYYWAINNGYRKGLDIDRIDNNKGYYPENCRWATRSQNTNNRRVTRYLTVRGETLPIAFWEKKLNLSRGLISQWLNAHDEEYAVKALEEMIDVGYKPRNYSRTHFKKVVCIETGEIFQSISDTAKHCERMPCTISNCIKNGRKVNGYTYAFYSQ